MKKVQIADTTLRRSAPAKGTALSFREKLETAKLLDRLGADVIELPQIVDAKADTLFMHTLAPLVGNAILSCACGLENAEIDCCCAALSAAAKPRLNVIMPLSMAQLEYTLHKKAEQTPEYIRTVVGYAVSLCPDVEFTAEDATRSDPALLRECLRAAIAAGASVITVSDSASLLLPDECTQFFSALRADLPELSRVTLFAECGNELQVGAANALAALLAGANGVKAAAGRVGAPALADVCGLLRARGEGLGLSAEISFTELHRALSNMPWFASETKKEPRVPAAVATGGVHLDSGADIDAVAAAAAGLGYALSPEELAEVYASFTGVANKKQVGARELEAIIASSSQVRPTYMLVSYVINTGSVISSTASVVLEKQGETLSGLCYGDGPIDAAFHAIEQMVGHHFELDDFNIHAVTEGREAVGETIIKLRSEGRLYSGRGVSTDIVESGIRAYLSALNKIVSEEK